MDRIARREMGSQRWSDYLSVRYIRVTQTHNSANTGRHHFEVMAFEN
jgi:hypothetical protein